MEYLYPKRIIVKHKLLINISESNVNHDLRWAYSMDIAISKGVLAAKYGLDKEELNFLQENFLYLLPKKDSPESLEEKAFIYYTEYFPQENTPWKARDICDYILALHHRIYSYTFNLEYWEKSKFKCVPIGLPRTKNVTVNARNYTHHNRGIYKTYANRLKIGKIFETPALFKYRKNKWIRDNTSNELIELTETDEVKWLHTRIPNIQKVWEIIEMLYQLAVDYKIEEKKDLNELIGMVAQIHWWLSHSMPYRRGSAAISDMFTKVIFQYHNITTPSWKFGIAPDLEAFCLSLEEYIVNYENFFDQNFIQVK